MAMNIEVAADVSSVITGTNKMADGYDKVSDTLKDMAREGDTAANTLLRDLDGSGKAATKLADKADEAKSELKDLGKAGKSAGTELERGLGEGEDGAKKLDRTVDDAFDAISANARKSGKSVADSGKDSFSTAARASSEFADETKANISETVSSFRGDVEDIPQIMQDILGGVSGQFGVLGLAVTAGLAAGIGIGVGKLQEFAEKNTEAAESAGALAQEIYDAGGAFAEADIAGKVKEIAFAVAEDDVWYKFGDQATTYVGMVREALDGLADANTQDVFKALAGDTEAAGRAQKYLSESLRDSTSELESHIIGYNELGPIYDMEGDAIVKNNDKRQELIKKIEEQSGVSQNASDDAAYFAEVMGAQAEETVSATEALAAHADALDAASGNAISLTEAENAYTETLGQLTADIAANGETMDRNTEAGRANRESLADLAGVSNSLRDAQIAQGVSTEQVTADAQAARDAFLAQADAAGLDAAAAAALADSYGLIPSNVETLVAANGTEEAKAKIEGVAAPTDAPVNVTTEGTEAAAQAGVDSVQGTTAPVEVTTEGTDAAVQGRINGIKGKNIKIDVDDEYTVKHVQNRINGIRGKTIKVTAELDTVQFYRDLAAATAARSMTVTVNQRKGTSVI